jgi:hypothetical protein
MAATATLFLRSPDLHLSWHLPVKGHYRRAVGRGRLLSWPFTDYPALRALIITTQARASEVIILVIAGERLRVQTAGRQRLGPTRAGQQQIRAAGARRCTLQLADLQQADEEGRG